MEALELTNAGGEAPSEAKGNAVLEVHLCHSDVVVVYRLQQTEALLIGSHRDDVPAAVFEPAKRTNIEGDGRGGCVGDHSFRLAL